MNAILRGLVVALAFAAPSLAPASAQDSTEPPPPRRSPVIAVTEESLPRAGGVMVFGGNRGLGLEIVKTLVAQNKKVTVLVRPSSDITALKELKVDMVTGDALNPDSVNEAFTSAPFRAAISTLGGHDGDYRVDVEGNKNAIDAAKNAGITRFVMVTALGSGDSAATAPWYVKWFLKDYFAAKTAAEDHLKASGLDYTIVRPGLLQDSDKPGEVTLVEGPVTYGAITRADLGKAVAATVEDTSTFKKVLTAVDAKRTGLWDMLTY
jgi:uncharacterized protein YbjT (DUF2867 family)